MSHAATVRIDNAPAIRSYDPIEKALLLRKRGLNSQIADLLREVAVKAEPDDEGAAAIQSYSTDWAAGALDRARRTLREVEGALARIKSGDYGVCDVCETSIPEARLEALPWARLCVKCAERNAGGRG